MSEPTEAEFAAAARETYRYDERAGAVVDKVTGRVVVIDQRKPRRVDLLGYPFLRSDVVWLLHRGEMPPAPLEHLNGDSTDDTFGNLGYRNRRGSRAPAIRGLR